MPEKSTYLTRVHENRWNPLKTSGRRFQSEMDTLRGDTYSSDLGIVRTLDDPRQNGLSRRHRPPKRKLNQSHNADGHYMFHNPGDLMFNPSFGPTNQAVRVLNI
uniref:Uncharacterized protein n=1 Tax=Lygus hesperus TaxID=30085 RepID=A0A0K8SNA2_LYGHE